MMDEATARELIAALKANTEALTRSAIAHEGVLQALLEGGEDEPVVPGYMDGSPR